MHRSLRLLLVPLAAAAFAAAPGFAQDDPKKEARLLYIEGKFGDAEKMLTAAGPDVAGDLDLRAQLADAAERFLKGKTGETRRGALEAMQKCFGLIAEGKKDTDGPAAGAALGHAVVAARELVTLDLAQKKIDDAMGRATWTIKLAEKVGVEKGGAEVTAALGESYGLRASIMKKPDKLEAVVADYMKATEMLVAASAGSEREAHFLGEAARMRRDAALFVHDTIPSKEEKRDEDGLVAAVDLANRATKGKNASDAEFDMHLLLLHIAHSWKLPVKDKPFMEPLEPAVSGLSIQIPKGSLWKRTEHKDWAMILERKFEGDTAGVQVMLKGYPDTEAFGGIKWSDFNKVVPAVFDAMHIDFSDVASEVKPTHLGPVAKKGPEAYHFQVAGTLAKSERVQRHAQWFWQGKNFVWNVKILDWRRPTEIEDPDLVAIVSSMLGAEGLWPSAGELIEDKDKKKDKPDKKKK